MAAHSAVQDNEKAASASSMDVDSPMKLLGRQAQFVWVESAELWGQEHDKRCKKFKAQELVECVLQSLVGIRMMRPLDNGEMAWLIGFVTQELDRRESLPGAAEDIANIFGALEFILPRNIRDDVWTPACVAEFGDVPDRWNQPQREWQWS